jgi:hypothetical protein
LVTTAPPDALRFNLDRLFGCGVIRVCCCCCCCWGWGVDGGETGLLPSSGLRTLGTFSVCWKWIRNGG